MNKQNYFYHCSVDYIASIDSGLQAEVMTVLDALHKRKTQAEINLELFWLLVTRGWSYDTKPPGLDERPPSDLISSGISLSSIRNQRPLCLSSQTLESNWHSDFAKSFSGRLVQLEAQFGKVEAMFKDFCGFQIAYHEHRLALGIEIVLCTPNVYFEHRKTAVSGMAYFDIAKKTLPTIGFDCPIWLVGIE